VISLIETIIAYCLADSELQEHLVDRVSGRHRYADTWKIGDVGLAIKPSGALPDLYRGHQVSDLDVRIYGPTYGSHLPVYARLIALSRSVYNAEVPTSQGVGLLRYWVAKSQPVHLADPDIHLPYTFFVMSAAAAETVIRS
jgi:hypothetical protein